MLWGMSAYHLKCFQPNKLRSICARDRAQARAWESMRGRGTCISDRGAPLLPAQSDPAGWSTLPSMPSCRTEPKLSSWDFAQYPTSFDPLPSGSGTLKSPSFQSFFQCLLLGNQPTLLWPCELMAVSNTCSTRVCVCGGGGGYSHSVKRLQKHLERAV